MKIKVMKKFLAPLLTLSALIIGAPPASAGMYTDNLCVKNTTEKPVLFQAINVDPYDFPRARNPSHNFNNVWLSAGEPYCATWDYNQTFQGLPGFNFVVTHSRDNAVFNIRFEMDSAGNWESRNYNVLPLAGKCPTDGYSYNLPVPASFDPSKRCFYYEFRR